MGLFRQAAIDAQRPKLSGDIIIPSSQWIGTTMLMMLLLMLGLGAWVLTRDYRQTQPVQGVTQFAHGEFSLVNKHNATVMDVHVQPNQSVVQGQALVTVSYTDFARYSTADILEQQQAKLRQQEQVTAQYTALNSAYRAERDFLHASIARTKQMLLNLQAQQHLHATELQALIAQSNKIRALVQRGFATEAQLLQAHSDVRSAKATQLQLSQQVLNHHEQHGNQEQHLANSEFEFATQQAVLLTQQTQIDDQIAALAHQSSAILYAPSDGIITQFSVKPGQTLLSAQAIGMIVPEEGDVIGVLQIPSHAAGHIYQGQAVQIQFAAYPHKIYGMLGAQISHIDTPALPIGLTPTASRTYQQRGGIFGLVRNTHLTMTQQWDCCNDASPIQIVSGMAFTAQIVVQKLPLWQKVWQGLTGNSSASYTALQRRALRGQYE